MVKHYYQNIEGWFNFEYLYSEVAKHAKPDAKFVEIGSFLGKSASFMAIELINQNKTDVEFYCVDNWKGVQTESWIRLGDGKFVSYADNSTKYKGDSLYKRFTNNIKPVKDYIKVLSMSSIEASKKFDDDSLDFVFIDAGHEYEEAKGDIEAWYPKVKKSGMLAGHDYTDLFPGVIKAVNEFCKKHKYSKRIIGTSWVIL